MLKLISLGLAGPLLFLVYIVVLVFVLVATGTPPEMAGNVAPGYAPHILVAVLATLGLIALRHGAMWPRVSGPALSKDLAIGAGIGIALAMAYILVLSPLHVLLQTHFGDYVPAGSTTGELRSALLPFFIANILLAPWVEETVYRGILWQRMQAHWSPAIAAISNCAAFGALHWAGGLWYILLTGTIAGGAFLSLRIWRGNLWAPFAAHLTLNVIEFVWLGFFRSPA